MCDGKLRTAVQSKEHIVAVVAASGSHRGSPYMSWSLASVARGQQRSSTFLFICVREKCFLIAQAEYLYRFVDAIIVCSFGQYETNKRLGLALR